MPGPKPTPRPSGGFKPSFGQMGESNMDEAAMQTMMQSMQQGSGTQQAAGGSAAQAMGGKQAMGKGMTGQKKVRPVGTLTEELIKNPIKDIIGEVKQFFSINTLLGINSEDSPEDQMKKKQMLQRWNQLNEEQQAVAKKRYQEEMQRKQQEEQEKDIKRQQEAQAKASAIQAPSSPKKGPVGPAGSKKQKATQQLQQNRQTIGKVAGAN